jgi:hypothetical protein
MTIRFGEPISRFFVAFTPFGSGSFSLLFPSQVQFDMVDASGRSWQTAACPGCLPYQSGFRTYVMPSEYANVVELTIRLSSANRNGVGIDRCEVWACDIGEVHAELSPTVSLNQPRMELTFMPLYGIQSSSADSADQEIECTVGRGQPGQPSFWSSAGSEEADAEEYLLYGIVRRSELDQRLLRAVCVLAFEASWLRFTYFRPDVVEFSVVERDSTQEQEREVGSYVYPPEARFRACLFVFAEGIPASRMRMRLRGKPAVQFTDGLHYHAIEFVSAYGGVYESDVSGTDASMSVTSPSPPPLLSPVHAPPHSPSPSPASNLQDNMSDEMMCVVCWTNRRQIAFIPCGHFTCCSTCAQHAIEQRMQCPTCRAPIVDFLRIYM